MNIAETVNCLFQQLVDDIRKNINNPSRLAELADTYSRTTMAIVSIAERRSSAHFYKDVMHLASSLTPMSISH